MSAPRGAPKRLHVLGGGLWQIPTIRLAKELGHEVLVTGSDPAAPGAAFADAYEAVDIRDRAGTLAAARRRRIDGIVCDTTDVGVPTAAYVAEALGLPGIGLETALRFTNKHAMRDAAAAAGVRNPRYAAVADEAQLAEAARAVGFPLIVKPVDSQSSRGVAKVAAPEALPAAFVAARAASAAGVVLVEAFVAGTEVTVEAVCEDGAVTVLGISDKEHYADRPQVASRLAYPAALPPHVLDEVVRTNAAVTRALGLRTGVTHAEYIVTPGEEVYLVEIAARGGGSRIYTHIAPYLSGIDVPRWYLARALGQDVRLPPPRPGSRAAVLAFLEVPSGVVRSVSGLEAARRVPGVVEAEAELVPGRFYAGAENDRARPGYVVAFGAARAEVIGAAEEARSSIRVEMER